MKLTAYYKDNKLRLQEYDYIDDGWYIEYDGELWHLYELMDSTEGNDHIGAYKTFKEAMQKRNELT